MMEEEAKRAIMELNGCLLNGNRLNVEVSPRLICVLRLPFFVETRISRGIKDGQGKVMGEIKTVGEKSVDSLLTKNGIFHVIISMILSLQTVLVGEAFWKLENYSCKYSSCEQVMFCFLYFDAEKLPGKVEQFAVSDVCCFVIGVFCSGAAVCR